MIDRRSLLAGSAGLALTLARKARADDVDDALRDIANARREIRTLTAGFEQVRQIGLLASEVRSTGKLWLVRPDRLRWQLDPPDAVTYWIGPKGIAVKNGDHVTKIGKSAAGKFGAVLGDLMVLLGGDLSKLRARYELKVERPDGKLLLTAVPTDAEVKKHLGRLGMLTDASLWRVERVTIEEPSGDRSDIAFRHCAKNEPIDPSVMEPPV